MLYLLVSGVFLTRIRRPTGKSINFCYVYSNTDRIIFFAGRLTVEEQKLEGEFRYVNSRLITNSEEVWRSNKQEPMCNGS